jgi:hypothetical protein
MRSKFVVRRKFYIQVTLKNTSRKKKPFPIESKKALLRETGI